MTDKERIKQLELSLAEAIFGWEACVQYKGDYLTIKHGDYEEIEELRKILNATGD